MLRPFVSAQVNRRDDINFVKPYKVSGPEIMIGILMLIGLIVLLMVGVFNSKLPRSLFSGGRNSQLQGPVMPPLDSARTNR
jgi:hypothetical protein